MSQLNFSPTNTSDLSFIPKTKYFYASHPVLTTTLWGEHDGYYPHFTDVETEFQRGEGARPRSHSYLVEAPALNPGLCFLSHFFRCKENERGFLVPFSYPNERHSPLTSTCTICKVPNKKWLSKLTVLVQCGVGVGVRGCCIFPNVPHVV